MAIITSGASSDQWTVDATSKAGRVTLYDPAGNELVLRGVPTGAYMLPVNIVQTGTTAAAKAVWAMRLVSSSRRVYIRAIVLGVSFNGTAAATTSRYDLARFSTATHTSGTAITVTKKKSSYGTSDVTDARFVDTGLTDTSVVYEAAFAMIGCQRQVSAAPVFSLIGDSLHTASPIELATGEGLAIQLGRTAVVGDGLHGYVAWDER